MHPPTDAPFPGTETRAQPMRQKTLCAIHSPRPGDKTNCHRTASRLDCPSPIHARIEPMLQAFILSLTWSISTAHANDVTIWRDQAGIIRHTQTSTSSTSAKGFDFNVDHYQFRDLTLSSPRSVRSAPRLDLPPEMTGKVYSDGTHCVTNPRTRTIDCRR